MKKTQSILFGIELLSAWTSIQSQKIPNMNEKRNILARSPNPIVTSVFAPSSQLTTPPIILHIMLEWLPSRKEVSLL